MAKTAKTPAQMIQKWQQGLSQAGLAYAAGTQATQKNPMLAAVAQRDKFVTNFNNSVERWASRTAGTPLQYWKDQCKVSAQKLAMGAQKGLAKYTRFANAAPAVYQSMKAAAEAAGMDPIARVTAALQVIMAAGKKQGGNGFGG